MIDPQDVIRNLTVESLCQSAEDYFKSIVDPIPQLAKPFSSLAEAPQILQNMGLLLSGLHLAKTMTVLEFAAGTCWFSRYLSQAQCQTISCDVSQTALKLGERLFDEFPIIGIPIAKPRFLPFDGHTINLPDESVDRIVCHDAFHHVPNQDEVLSELCRVLKAGGVAGFSEPGRYHSKGAQSQYEMRNYKVLENDVLVDEIVKSALRHGFTDMKLKLLCDMEVSIDGYHKLIERQHDQSFAAKMVENVADAMINKTIFFLYKGTLVLDSRGFSGLSHSISCDARDLSARAGEALSILIRVVNIGGAKWLDSNINDIGVVKVGTHLYDASNTLMALDFSRHRISKSINPGDGFEMELKVKFSSSGEFTLAVDLVSEGICWFENAGSKPLLIKVRVA